MKILYSTFGRVCHGYYDMGPGTYGPYVMDDFGNAVKVQHNAVVRYLRTDR